MLLDFCSTFTLSEASDFQRDNADAYFRPRLARPDKGSKFARHLGHKRFAFFLPGFLGGNALTHRALDRLLEGGYDAVCVEYTTDLVGHAAFQQKKDGIHLFATHVAKHLRGEGIGRMLDERVIDVARQRNVDRVKVGDGGNEGTRAIYDSLCRDAERLRVTPQPEYWLQVHQ